MKKLVLILLFVVFDFCCLQTAQAQKKSIYYYRRVTLFAMFPVHHSDIIFLGGTNTNICEWQELFDNKHILNRGILGDDIQGVYDRLGEILKGKPKKIFLLIGSLDLARGSTPDSVAKGIGKIADRIKQKSPGTKLFIQSLLPVDSSWRNEIMETNEILKTLCQKKHLKYIDLYDSFKKPGTTKLKPEYTNDGRHLLGSGFLLWKQIISPYVK